MNTYWASCSSWSRLSLQWCLTLSTCLLEDWKLLPWMAQFFRYGEKKGKLCIMSTARRHNFDKINSRYAYSWVEQYSKSVFAEEEDPGDWLCPDPCWISSKVITNNLTTLIIEQISGITYYKWSSDQARGKLPVSILVGMIEVITDSLTTQISDQVSVITQ